MLQMLSGVPWVGLQRLFQGVQGAEGVRLDGKGFPGQLGAKMAWERIVVQKQRKATG